MSTASRTSSPWWSRNSSATVLRGARRLSLTAAAVRSPAQCVPYLLHEPAPVRLLVFGGPCWVACGSVARRVPDLPRPTGPGWHAWGMPRTLSIHGLRELLDEQLAVASRGQLLALGMNDRAMQYRLRPDGPWQALLPGIYLAVTGTPTFEQKEMAALLYDGPESLVTGRAALWHHGIGSGCPPPAVTNVLLPPAGLPAAGNSVPLPPPPRRLLPLPPVPPGAAA